MAWKRTKNQWERAKAARVALEALHPDLFSLDAPVPFKIGIDRDIKKRYPEIPSLILRLMMGWLTRRRAYLRACVAGADRIGFDGPDGIVTEKNAEHAVRLHIWRDENEARRAQRREAAA